MNYLSLANALVQKCGISGVSLTTLQNQTGEAGRVAAWIDEAYLNVQLAYPNWDWMRATVSFPTVSGQGSYTPTEAGVTDFGWWKQDSFRRYITATGVRSETFLSNIRYDAYRDTYLFGNMRLSNGDPLVVAFGPDLSINLGLIPGDVGYTIVGEYFKQPLHLTLDADTPLIPSQYHQIIVYRAMMMYGMYEAAQEVTIEGTNLYNTMLRRLVRDQLSDVQFAGSLA